MAVCEAGTDRIRLLNEPTDGRERAVANVLGVDHRDAPPPKRR
jgi:hypothetical protein